MLDSEDTTVLVHYLEGQASRRLLTSEDGTLVKPPSKRRKATAGAPSEAGDQIPMAQQAEMPAQPVTEPAGSQQVEAASAPPPSLPSPADLSTMPVCSGALQTYYDI
jgi:hypothetical protein